MLRGTYDCIQYAMVNMEWRQKKISLAALNVWSLGVESWRDTALLSITSEGMVILTVFIFTSAKGVEALPTKAALGAAGCLNQENFHWSTSSFFNLQWLEFLHKWLLYRRKATYKTYSYASNIEYSDWIIRRWFCWDFSRSSSWVKAEP